MKTDKKVTNLLINIGKVRDILEKKDFELVVNNQLFINKVVFDLIRNVKKYVESDKHEIDFNSNDMLAIADGLQYFDNKFIKSNYKIMNKELEAVKYITIEEWNKLCYKVRDRFYYDKYVRPLVNELNFMAVTLDFWSLSEYRMDFMSQITQHLKTFI